jgi:hypothetical protein
MYDELERIKENRYESELSEEMIGKIENGELEEPKENINKDPEWKLKTKL